jgi:hypothetical protein
MMERFKMGDIIQWVRDNGGRSDELLILSNENDIDIDCYYVLNLVDSEIQDNCWFIKAYEGHWEKLA